MCLGHATHHHNPRQAHTLSQIPLAAITPCLNIWNRHVRGNVIKDESKFAPSRTNSLQHNNILREIYSLWSLTAKCNSQELMCIRPLRTFTPCKSSSLQMLLQTLAQVAHLLEKSSTHRSGHTRTLNTLQASYANCLISAFAQTKQRLWQDLPTRQ